MSFVHHHYGVSFTLSPTEHAKLPHRKIFYSKKNRKKMKIKYLFIFLINSAKSRDEKRRLPMHDSKLPDDGKVIMFLKSRKN